MKIVESPISKTELVEMAKNLFGDFVKAVVDVEKEIMAVGGELHADAEALLLEHGSKQENLWGINMYVDRLGDEWIKFDSMINIRPSQGNRSRSVEDTTIQLKIRTVVDKLISQ